ncbi:MAG: hypothetical protein COS97_01255, partial [Candidatus Nealsonbacteria bacterium CG07_land_8_20_14_0_80_40_10]
RLGAAEQSLGRLSEKLDTMMNSVDGITDADKVLAVHWEKLYNRLLTEGQCTEKEVQECNNVLISIRCRLEALEQRVSNLEVRVGNLESRPQSQPYIKTKKNNDWLYVVGIAGIVAIASHHDGDVTQINNNNPPQPQQPPYGKPCPYWRDHVAELAHQGFITDEYDSRWYFRGWSWYDVDQQLQNHLLTCPYALQSGSYTGNPEQPWDPQDGGPSIGDAIVQKGDIKLSLTNLTLPRLTFGPLSVIIGGDRLEAVGISLGNFTFTQSRTGYLLGFDDQKTIKLLVGQGFLSLRTQPTKSTSVGLSIIGGRPEGRLMATARF